jgi:hypothetical protein
MMRRILVLLTVVALMVAMMAVMAVPAFADHSTGHSQSQVKRESIDLCLASPVEPGASECV